MQSIDVEQFLHLRRQVHIVHQVPGRIRLRLGPGLWGKVAKADRDILRQLLERLQGIDDVRVNPAVATVIIQYDPDQVLPQDWATLVEGEAQAAETLVHRWLQRLQVHLKTPSTKGIAS
jgi:Heavy metal associated domain 2